MKQMSNDVEMSDKFETTKTKPSRWTRPSQGCLDRMLNGFGALIRFQVLVDMGVHVDIGLRPDRASLAEGQAYIIPGDGNRVESLS